MEDLIPLINQLQSIFKKTGMEEMKLPEIVVVGSQSSGKSSVLESLVKKSFLPRGTGIVTRCPIILQLINVPVRKTPSATSSTTDKFKRQSKTSPPPAEEWCRFSKNPEIVYTDFDEVRKAIEDLQVEMAGDKKGISMESIILEVFSPNVIDLTVVDLPGIVKVALDGQPVDIEEQVYDLIKRKISNDSAIILAVSPANADIATSESIKLAKEVDPDGNRTIAVVTKLDIMDKGTDAANVLNGEVIKVKLGIVGVINRSQRDINNNTTMEEVLHKEETFLKKHYPQIHGIHGSRYLAIRLNHLLTGHIQKNLPALIKRIGVKTKECEAELLSLGKEISAESNECSWLIMETTLKFVAKFHETVFLRPLAVKNGEDLFAGHVTDTFKKLREGIVIHADEIDAPEILTALKNTLNFEGFSSIEQVFKTMVQEEILKMEGPAVKCSKKVHDLLSETAGKSFIDKRLTGLNNTIKGVVDDLLAEQLKHVEHGIKEHIQLQTGMIFTSDQDFVRCLTGGPEATYNLETELEKEMGELALRMQQDAMNRRVDPITAFPMSTEYSINEQNDLRILYVHKLIVKYLNVVKRELSDYIPKYLMFQLARKTIEKISDATKAATVGKETALVAEPDDIRIKRKNAQALLTSLREATKILRNIKMQQF